MAYLYLPLPLHLSEQLSALSVLGQKVDPSTFHVTLAYLERKMNLAQIENIISPLYQIFGEFGPIPISTGKIDSFPADPEYGYPIYLEVISSELTLLQKRLLHLLDQEDIYYDKSYPDFKPHITLSYSSVYQAASYTTPIESSLTSIICDTGAYERPGMQISIPLVK